jgi:hypothetical protein
MNSITAANRSHLPPVSNERRLLIAKRGDGTDVLYDEAGVCRELNGVLRRIGIGSYIGFNGLTEPGVFMYDFNGDAGCLIVSETGNRITRRLFMADGMTVRRSGTLAGNGMKREVRHPEPEPAYSTVAGVTPKLWTDGEHTCRQVFTVTEPAASETFHTLLDIKYMIFDASGTAAEGGTVGKPVSKIPGLDIFTPFNGDLTASSNTDDKTGEIVLAVKMCPQFPAGGYRQGLENNGGLTEGEINYLQSPGI